MSLLPGYTHTFVLKQRSMPPSGFFAGGMISFNLTNQKHGDPDRLGTACREPGDFATGYNGHRFYTGITANIDTYNISWRSFHTRILLWPGTFLQAIRLSVPEP